MVILGLSPLYPCFFVSKCLFICLMTTLPWRWQLQTAVSVMIMTMLINNYMIHTIRKLGLKLDWEKVQGIVNKEGWAFYFNLKNIQYAVQTYYTVNIKTGLFCQWHTCKSVQCTFTWTNMIPEQKHDDFAMDSGYQYRLLRFTPVRRNLNNSLLHQLKLPVESASLHFVYII